MFNRALTLVLIGVLFMGTTTLIYGTFFDKGLGASVAGILGQGEGDDDDHDEGERDDD